MTRRALAVWLAGAALPVLGALGAVSRLAPLAPEELVHLEEIEPGPCRPPAPRRLPPRAATAIRFADEPAVIASELYSPAIADLDRDGDLDLLGAEQVRGGFRPVAAEALGLGALFADGRQARDNRLVDLDGDSDLDLVANGYDVWPRART